MCTECCSMSRHWHTQVRPQLVTLAAWGIALARRPTMYPLQTGSRNAVQGSWVPSQLLYTSLRHSQPMSFTVNHSTSPDHNTLPAQHFQSSGLLCRWSDGLELADIPRHSWTVSVTRCSAATASDNRWKRTYFVITTQRTQCSRDAS